MDRYRWSDGQNFSVEFKATDKTLYDAALDALIDARKATGRRFHDGGTRTNRVWYPSLQLHWKRPNGYEQEWYMVGIVRHNLVIEGKAQREMEGLNLKDWLEKRDRMAEYVEELDGMIRGVCDIIKGQMEDKA